MVTFEGGQYSVPHTAARPDRSGSGSTGRGADEQVVIVHVGPTGPVEVARHARADPGQPADERRALPAARRPGPWIGNREAKNAAEAEFLALGDGARLWLTEAAAAGTTKMRVKMAEAVATGQAVRGRPRSTGRSGTPPSTPASPRPTWPRSWTTTHATTIAGPTHRAGEDHSLTQGTASWAALGDTTTSTDHRWRGALVSRARATPLTRHRCPSHGVPTAAAAARGRRGAAAPVAAAAHPRATPPRWSPPPKRNAGNRSRCCAPCSPRRPPAGNAPRWPPAGPRRRSPPARPSTPGSPARPRSRPRPSRRCAPWNGCTDGRTWWSAGRPGTGKTFLLEALGQHAVEHGLKVAWFTLEDLGVLLRRHRADDTVTKAIARVLRADLVVVDDIGLLPVAQDAAEGLYRLVDAAYEKRSVAVSSQPAPRRVRRAHAQDPRDRDRRPAPAPRPRLPDQRRQRPPLPSPRRTRGEPLDLSQPRR